jgi:Zn-dependent protease with chaperone function
VSVVLVLTGLALVATPAGLSGAGRRMAPPEWCRAVVACLRTGRLGVHAGLWMAFVPVVLGVVGADGLAHACHEAFGARPPLPAAAGWLAGGLLAVSTWRSRAARRHRRRVLEVMRAEPWLGEHRLEAGVDVVTLPCTEPLAYAVPGRPDQIAVTEGLASALDDDEMEAVVRHEQSHLRWRHDEALAVGADIEARFGWFAPARRSASGLRLAVERWADEDAGIGSEGARPAVRRALVKAVALSISPVAAFSDVETIAARLDALAVAPPRSGLRARLAATGPAVVLSTLVAGSSLVCAAVAHHGIDEVLGHCAF